VGALSLVLVDAMLGATQEPSVSVCPPRKPKFFKRRGDYLGFDGTPQRYGPPILWTVPGSGNTMMRQLLEDATGIRTGSVQHDSRLINAGFLGEGRVDHDVVAVKVHHAHFPIGAFPIRLSKSSTGGAKVWRQFAVTSTIAVVRNPLDAFFAQYQLQHTPFEGSHTSRIATKDFEAQNFARDGLRFASLWNRTLAAYGAFAQMRCYVRAQNLPRLGNRQAERCRLGVWKFETLIDRGARMRAFEELVDFLQLPPAHVPAREALVCAFNASDAAARRTRRPHDDTGQFVTKARAYALADEATPHFVCRFWAYVREYAEKLEYAPPAACALGSSGGDYRRQ
jgi:hypothetical protein